MTEKEYQISVGRSRTETAWMNKTVTWATSNDETMMVPDRTEFQTVSLPATPRQLLRWLNGESLQSVSKN